MQIRTLIVDDQLIARELLRRMLMEEPDVEIVGSCSTGLEAVEQIETLKPDLVFLDVQMPGLDGFSVLARLKIKPMPEIIFVTANDDLAVKAFEVNALDYLVKPATMERLGRALQHARDHLRHHRAGQSAGQLTALLQDLKTEPRRTGRLAVKADGRILFVKMEDIDWVEAADNYATLHVGAESMMMRETMATLETRLDPCGFVRVSRSAIVNTERVRELQPLFHGEYALILQDGTKLTLTRSYRKNLARLGLA